MRLKIGILILILTCGIFPVFSNSIFSNLGYPEQSLGLDTYSSGMGNSGIGDLFRKNSSLLNPSLSTSNNKVIFGTGISFGYIRYTDNNNNYYTQDGIHFPYMNIIVPIKQNRFSFNFTSYLSGDLKFQGDINKEIDGETITGTETQEITSYIYKASVGWANKNRLLNFGFSFDYFIGNRKLAWSQNYDEDNYFDTKEENNKTFKNCGLTFGINKRWEKYSFGAYYGTYVKLTGDTDYQTIHHEETISNSEFEIPHRLGVGSAYKISDKFRLSFDLHYELWENTDSYDDSRNTYQICSGIAYEPNWGYGKLYEKIPLRAGFNYRQLPFKSNNSFINEYTYTTGFSIPLSSPDKRLDFSVSLTNRGDESKNLYKDRTLFFSIGITGYDIFRKRVRRVKHRDIPKPDKESWR